MSNEENGKLTPKRDRYWSVMLVGDRGRIIPFRHFKGIALGVCCVTFLLLAALITLSILYTGQRQKLADLETQLESSQLQSSKLRDEKDLYLTKLMVAKKRETAGAQQLKTKPETPSEPVRPQPEKARADSKTIAPAPIKKEPAKAPAPKVKWKADIRRFSVSYDPKREVLKAQFRIYNMSKPKKRLSGRSVVVFKVLEDPPIKWLPVPRVQLRDGEPTGSRGQVFRVKNYLTVKFRAYRQKTPVRYNTATVFVFSEDGRILASKDFAFKIAAPKIAAPPVVKKQPVQAPSETEKAPSEPTRVPAAAPAEQPPQEPVPVPLPVPNDSGGAVPIVPQPPVQGPADTSPSGEKTQAPAAETPTATIDPPVESGTPAGESNRQIQADTPPETGPNVKPPQPIVEGESK